MLDTSNQQTRYEDLYFDQVDKLGNSCEMQTIETSFGLAQVLSFGEPDKKPLVLLPGAIGCALIVLEASMKLASNYNIYVVTEMFRANPNSGVNKLQKNNQYAQWLYEIISRLDIKNITLVGFSFGAYVAAKLLAYDERSISKAFLIMPEGIIAPNYGSILKEIISTNKKGNTVDKTTVYEQFIQKITTTPNPFHTEVLPNLWLLSSGRIAAEQVIQPQESSNIKTPLYLVVAEDDTVFSYKLLFEKAAELFPSFKGGLLLNNSSHIPNKQGVKKIIQFIKNQDKY